MASRLRPELVDGDGTTPCMRGGTAYLMVLSAVEQQEQLIHGRLHAHGAHCAIGSYFDVNKTTLEYSIINEVAAVNDSVPHLSGKQRKLHVARWLKWKLATLGMPGFKAVDKQTGKRTR